MKLFQIEMTREIADRVNAGFRVPAYEAHLKASCFGEFPGQGFYRHVADIATTDLDEAFHIGNVGPEEKLTRYAPMHSVSVGDVLVLDDGRAFIVKACGFDLIVKGWNVTSSN